MSRNPKAVKRCIKQCQSKILMDELLLPKDVTTINTDEMLADCSDHYTDLYINNEPNSVHRFELMQFLQKTINDGECKFLAADFNLVRTLELVYSKTHRPISV